MLAYLLSFSPILMLAKVGTQKSMPLDTLQIRGPRKAGPGHQLGGIRERKWDLLEVSHTDFSTTSFREALLVCKCNF
jgi:hypothetical protein